MNLLEQYSKRLKVSESVYARGHQDSLSRSKKLAIATLLNNTNRFMTEAYQNSVGTQRADLGMWKKFALNLTTVALPNLIAEDLVVVYPMTSMSGYINYLKFTYGSNKGEARQGEVINDPFRLGKVDTNYTSAKVVETIATGQTELAWGPVVGKVELFVDGEWVEQESYTPHVGDKVRYHYDNVVIPQNDLPIINAEMASIPLVAKARRVAITRWHKLMLQRY